MFVLYHSAREIFSFDREMRAGFADQNAQSRSANRRVCLAEVPGALLICSVRIKRKLNVIGSKTR